MTAAVPAPPIELQVNGQLRVLQVPPEAPLLQVLRNDLRLNGPKYGCGLGQCGACAVLVDGQVARSCCIPAGGMQGRSVTTLEGLGTRAAPHWVQQAFIDTQAAQCGYCLNGMVMATVALLTHCPQPTEAQIREALAHHLCRCGTHIEILSAVRRAVVLRDQAAAKPPHAA
ncbi:(2Fe-2S)-binding protein [Aquincola sp. J276]|uniref:(2Fe-2S)-binding protein n=1 Tax=Aquincola sp. J276 TaxID=2898432 RepID=UPI0038571CC1